MEKQMRTLSKMVFLFELGLLIWPGAAAMPQDSGEQEKSLGDIARELRGNKKTENPCPSSNPCDVSHPITSTSSGEAEDDEQQYRTGIQSLVARRSFADLDDAADKARSSKGRVRGGAWKLYFFYVELATPVSGLEAPEGEWKERLSLIQNWVKERPASITARVALAQCYRYYAWAARGTHYANEVTDNAWTLYNARVGQAYATLTEAENLPAKCPHWFFVMLELARDQGWDKDKSQAVFERAISFEPYYYHYYREYALDLDPKWNGEPGDAEALAEESLRRIGGRQGAFVYFEIATVLYCTCSPSQHSPTLSWRKIQEGFAVMEESYGTTTIKLNRMAAMACKYNDRDVAKRILARIGDNWEPEVWVNWTNFNQAKAWVGPPKP